MGQRRQQSESARGSAARAVAQLVRADPEFMPVSTDHADLDERDRRLAHAIYRATVDRWLTIRWLLNRHIRHGLAKVEPRLQAIMMTGAAQVLFMDRLPVHAAVDESVALAKRTVRPSAGAMVNAVLRQVADAIEDRRPDAAYEAPDPHEMPFGGGVIRFREALFPPVKTLVQHLSIVTSHPAVLIERWIQVYGKQRTVELALHSHKSPPIVVAGARGPVSETGLVPHAEPGLAVWTGESEDLVGVLAAQGAWVQDAASYGPVAATAALKPATIIDYCAGKGTKTRQLARLHPAAHITASDTDSERFEALRAAFAGSDRVEVVDHASLHGRRGDLVVLDVPCSNTGVLARRLEARYRYSAESVESLVRLQRSIVERAAPLVNPGGALLYATCSIEPKENEEQSQWIASKTGLGAIEQRTVLPDGDGPTYHDGGFYSLWR